MPGEFEVIPAVDIRGGRCVRLTQGDFGRATEYYGDPVDAVRRWVDLGAARIHIVDLDGAAAGRPVNAGAVAGACKLGVPVQVGGGIRSVDLARAYFDLGVAAVIAGTVAVEDPEVLTAMVAAFPGRVLVGIDARNGKVATRGWAEQTARPVSEVLRGLAGLRIAGINYTDIARDGTGEGINLRETVAVARQVPVPVYAAGGVRTAADVAAVAGLPGGEVRGVIVGRALYEGTLTFQGAVAAAEAMRCAAPAVAAG